MIQNKFVRSDGSVIDSSSVISCTYTSCVNSSTNLTVGDVTADTIEVELRTPTDMITAGERLTYYQIINGEEKLINSFHAEAPTVASKTSIRFKAYDAIAKLETDFSEWLDKNQASFPMTLSNLLYQVGNISSTAISPSTLPTDYDFAGLMIPAFYAQGITCRQIVSWAAQLAGCFAKCNEYGSIVFSWYDSSAATINVGDIIQDGFSKKSYVTDDIARVQFKQTADDVGIIYPAEADGNVFTISGNGLAALLDTDTLSAIAQYLYNKLKSIRYTPLSLRTVHGMANSIKPGTNVNVYGSDGALQASSIIMSMKTSSRGVEYSSTGDQSYSDKAAVASERYKNIPGKVLELEKSVDGLRVRADDMDGKYSEIEQTAGTVNVTVSKDGGTLSTIIDGTGVWKSVYTTEDGTVSSSLVFDFDKGQFVLTGGTLESSMVYVPEGFNFADYNADGTWLDGSGARVISGKSGIVLLSNMLAFSDIDAQMSTQLIDFSLDGGNLRGTWTLNGKPLGGSSISAVQYGSTVRITESEE